MHDKNIKSKIYSDFNRLKNDKQKLYELQNELHTLDKQYQDNIINISQLRTYIYIGFIVLILLIIKLRKYFLS